MVLYGRIRRFPNWWRLRQVYMHPFGVEVDHGRRGCRRSCWMRWFRGRSRWWLCLVAAVAISARFSSTRCCSERRSPCGRTRCPSLSGSTRPIHQPVLWLDMDRTAAGTPFQARPLQHLVEASKDSTHPRHKLQLDSAQSPWPSSASSMSCDHCCEPSNMNRGSCSCECHVSFMMHEISCQIQCEGAGHGCAAIVLMLQVEYGVADHPAHAGRGSALIPSFSTQPVALHRVCRCGDADSQILTLLEVFVQGFVATILTLVLIQDHFRRRPRTTCFMNYSGPSMLQICMSRSHTSGPLQAVVHAAFAILMPLGLIGRRRVRASPLTVLRFS